jgi:hypothetical protein
MVIGLALLLTAILLGPAFAVTRIQSDNSDTTFTCITTSLGGIYNATAEDVRRAMWSMNDTGGVEHVPAGTYAFTSDLIVTGNVTLIGEFTENSRVAYTKGTVFTLTGDASIIVVYGRLQNIQVNTITGWTADCAVIVNGSTYVWEKQKLLDNLNVRNAIGTYGSPTAGSFTGTGIALVAVGSVKQACIGLCDFGSIDVGFFNLGVLLYANDSNYGAYVNGNTFERIGINRCTYGMNLTGADAPTYSAVSGNTFLDYEQQPRNAPGSKGGISLYHDCAYNNFQSIAVWDWDAQHIVAGSKVITIDGCSNNIFTSAILQSSDINDSGYGNIFNLASWGSDVYTVYPMGKGDGTNIDYLLYRLHTYDARTVATIIFTPGTYDIDVPIYFPDVKCDFQFMEGTTWKVNASLFPSGNYALALTPHSTIRGPGIIDMNNVPGARGVKLNNSCVMDGLEIRKCSSNAIYVAGSYVTISNCNLSGQTVTFLTGVSHNIISGNIGWNYPFISNSKGNYWPATNETNIRAAANDLNATGGTVYVPGGSFNFSHNFTIDNNVTIKGVDCWDNAYTMFKGTRFSLTGATTIILKHGKLQDVQVNCLIGWTGDYAVLVSGDAYNWQTQYILDNVNVYNNIWNYAGTGIGFVASRLAAGAPRCIALCTFGPFSVSNFNLGVLMLGYDNVGGGGYVNGNTFESIEINQCNWALNMTTGGTGPGQCQGNTIVSINIEPRWFTGSKGGIYVKDAANIFSSIQTWDWYGSLLKVSGARNIFTGLSLWIYKTSYINVTGNKNVFIMSPDGNSTAKMIINDGGTGNNFIGGRYADNWGNTSIANNGTINHGLFGTPTVISVNAEQWYIYAHETAKNATCFWVSIIDLRTNKAAVGTYYITWRAKV